MSGAALTASATPGDAKNRDASCLTDYVMIAQGHDGSQPATSLKVDRYCGQALGACEAVLQKVPSEANPKVRNHGEGPY